MKVSTLIKKLQKMPQDAEVLIPNYYDWNEGDYVATEVREYIEDGVEYVEIGSNYKKKIGEV